MTLLFLFGGCCFHFHSFLDAQVPSFHMHLSQRAYPQWLTQEQSGWGTLVSLPRLLSALSAYCNLIATSSEK